MSNDKVYLPYTGASSGLPSYALKDSVTKAIKLYNAEVAAYNLLQKKYLEAKATYEETFAAGQSANNPLKLPRDIDHYTATLSSGVARVYLNESYLVAPSALWIKGAPKPIFGKHIVTNSGYWDGTKRWVEFTVPNSFQANVTSTSATYSYSDVDGIKQAYDKFISAKQSWLDAQKYLDTLKADINKKLGLPSTSKTETKTDNSKGNVYAPDDTLPVTVNLPGIKDAYFSSNAVFTDDILFTTAGNRPSVDIEKASQLWKNSEQSSKGMIQSYVIPNGLASGNQQKQPELASMLEVNKSRYAFRFIYNPGTISMDYAGAPAVDIGLEISGRDKIPLVGSAASSSTISFQLLLNRMQDMKYLKTLVPYSREDQFARQLPSIEPEWASLYGTTPSKEDLNKIRDRGTMYDLEFLFRTLIGYALPSQLRGFTTADIGYLGAYPVELHLGKSLRYLVTITSISVSHTIFTSDMVPVFTNVAISCNRLPDFPYSANTKSALETYNNSTSSTSTSNNTETNGNSNNTGSTVTNGSMSNGNERGGR